MRQDELRQRVAELVAIGQLNEAARLLATEGNHADASILLEEACDFAAAALQALAAGDVRRAALLAALGGDDKVASDALDRVNKELPRDSALRVATDLLARGHAHHAALLFEELGEHVEAARAFVAAYDACRAAHCFEKAGLAAEGARALETALRRQPDDAVARLELGQLLARHGRTETALRTLQKLPDASPQRQLALPLIARCLAELGLAEAARNVQNELDQLGVSIEQTTTKQTVEPDHHDPGEVRLANLLFGRYETLRDVAATPHARLLQARDRITGERVAVKIFAGVAPGSGRDALLRFEREASALSQLRHPNIVTLRAYHADAKAMVLSWMDGGSLWERLQKESVTPARAVEIACALLSALGQAHRLGILHRDVKPSNVLFDEVGTAYLSDFGAAHLGDLSSTATAGTIGTFTYMSPEQRLGKPATLASDLYGVGAVLAEMLMGVVPPPTVSGQLDPAPSAIHSMLTGAHDAVVASLLHEDPHLRPNDAFEARSALMRLSWPEHMNQGAPPRAPHTHVSEKPSALSQDTRVTTSMRPNDGKDLARRRHDTWLARDILVIPLNDISLARARAFAQAGHPSLATILRIDVAAKELWVAAPQGNCLADAARGVSKGQMERLAEAIAALHTAGGRHGCIDANHIYLQDGEVFIAYPRDDATTSTVDADLEALGCLSPGSAA